MLRAGVRIGVEGRDADAVFRCSAIDTEGNFTTICN